MTVSKRENRIWRKFWDFSFSASSILSSLLVGVALGNIALGINIDAGFEYAGSFFQLLNPYAVLVGITTVAAFMMHGAIYVVRPPCHRREYAGSHPYVKTRFHASTQELATLLFTLKQV